MALSNVGGNRADPQKLQCLKDSGVQESLLKRLSTYADSKYYYYIHPAPVWNGNARQIIRTVIDEVITGSRPRR